MQKKYYLYIVILLMICSCVKPEGGGLYSPLYKYRNYSIEKITAYSYNHSLEYHQVMFLTNMKILKAYRGIISNYWDSFVSNDNVYIVDNNSTNHVCNLNMNNITFIGANLKYLAYLSNDTFYVNSIAGSNFLILPVVPTNFIVRIGYGESPVIAYGVKKYAIHSYTNIAGEGTVWDIGGFEYDVIVYNLTNGSSKEIDNVKYLIGFSPNNKYLFYNYVAGRKCSDPVTNAGIVEVYNIISDESTVIGILENEYYSDWLYSDWTLGISSDLHFLYLYQGACQSYGVSGELEDGRISTDIWGVWRVDISPLGLSE